MDEKTTNKAKMIDDDLRNDPTKYWFVQIVTGL